MFKKLSNQINFDIIKTKKALSLLEVSIIITVIGIFISGSLAIATFANSINKKKITDYNFLEIYRAIGLFISKNGRLPCPSPLNLDRDFDTLYGAESKSIGSSGCLAVSGGVFNNGLISYGAVPSKSLGLASAYAEDGFGNKITYIVDSRFTDKTVEPIDFTNSPSFGAVNIADQSSIIYIKKRDNDGTLIDHEPKAIFVLISHGNNGFGSFPANSRISNNTPPASNLDEINNYFGNPIGSFDNVVISSSDSDSNFDDSIYFKTRANLISDYNLNWLIACDGQKITFSNYPKIPVFFGEQINSTDFCPNSQTTFIKCGSDGVWETPSSC